MILAQLPKALADAAQQSGLEGTTVIGIDHDFDFIDEDLVWTTNNPQGCYGGYAYQAPSMPSGWNDKVDAATAYQGCTWYAHFHDINFGDPKKICTCATMGSMEDETSSEKWRRRSGDSAVGVGINAELTGSITGSSLFEPVSDTESDSPGLPTGYTVTGHCSFAGVLTPNNQLSVAYGGFVAATGPQVPQLAYVMCSIQNALSPPNIHYSEGASGGPASPTLATAGPWPVSPITICVEGFAVYGPTPVTIINLAKTCDSLV